MPGPKFHETGYGHRFFDAQLPQLTKAINRLAEAIEKQAPNPENEMKRRNNEKDKT